VIQCCECVKLGCDEQSFHCSSACFKTHWKVHKSLHESALAHRKKVQSVTPVKFSTPSKPRPATIQAPIPMSTMNLVKVGTA